MKNTTTFIFFLTVLSLSCNNSNMNSRTGSTTLLKPTESNYATVNGLKMYYEIYGQGEPLVLIHGGGSTIQTTFGNIIPLLAQDHKIIAVEMQAHGRTADINRPLSFEQDADDIAALLKHLKIEKASLCGFSNGASTTLQFAIRHPQLTDKIVVASTFYKKSGAFNGFWEMMNTATFESMPKAFKDAFIAVNPDTSALHQMYKRDVARMRSFNDIPDQLLASIKAPTLIIAGDKDVVTPEHAAEMHRMIKNSRLAILPGGHGDYLGEVTTPQDSALISYTASLVKKFLRVDSN